MEVRAIVQLLLNTYEPEEHLLIDWVDKFQAEVDTDEQWIKVVDRLEGGDEGMIDMWYVQSIIDDVIEEEE